MWHGRIATLSHGELLRRGYGSRGSTCRDDGLGETIRTANGLLVRGSQQIRLGQPCRRLQKQANSI